MNLSTPTYSDFKAVRPNAAPMKIRGDDAASRDALLEKHDDDDAAAEQAEENQENAEIVEAARRNGTDG